MDRANGREVTNITQDELPAGVRGRSGITDKVGFLTVSRVSGSIYDGFSPRGQQALATLRGEFRAAGFYAEKERRTERSLRVYPERRWRYPLLNPFFVRARRDSAVPVGGPAVLCPIYSDGDAQI